MMTVFLVNDSSFWSRMMPEEAGERILHLAGGEEFTRAPLRSGSQAHVRRHGKERKNCVEILSTRPEAERPRTPHKTSLFQAPDERVKGFPPARDLPAPLPLFARFSRGQHLLLGSPERMLNF